MIQLPPVLNIGEPSGPSGPFWSLVRQNGNVVAMQITSRANAELFACADRMFAVCISLVEPAGDSFEELQTLARDAIQPLLDRIKAQALEGIREARMEAPHHEASQ